jgi:NADH-quinone oxidoreductase subunit L
MTLNDFLSNPNLLPWLIPVGPLLAFFVIILLTNRGRLAPRLVDTPNYPRYGGMPVSHVTITSKHVSMVVGLIGILLAWGLSLSMVNWALNPPEEMHFGEEVFSSTAPWLATGMTAFNMGVLVDPLTTVMLIMVPLACTMIFIYSVGYIYNDPRAARFFAYISLFAGAMLTLVVADNLLLLFVGWEVMGLCSYLLIGFWHEKRSAYEAAIKAFTTTRVADVIMLLGIAYLYASTGTLSFREILYNPETLENLAATPAIILGSWGFSAAGLIGVFLIIGTIGKSAQFPLHVWLPDAMEGPTPVSAMIHAAAMVSAGIYAIIRMYPLFEAGAHPHQGEFNTPLLLMAIVGAFTALFAATIAVAQNDVKRVLAYSTISQLGFMMAALGVGAYIAAAFHLITHGFFKALLFMASGAVIHGMEHGEHHVHEMHHTDDDEHGHEQAGDAEHVPHFDPQDMMNMGGLRRTMPVTFITFLIGGLSLAGFPLVTAGFWSKDEILAESYLGLTEGFGPHAFVFVLLAITAFITAFYTMRQLGLTFWGEPRTEEAAHASLGEGLISATMTFPLIFLAFFAVVAGFVGVPSDFPILGSIFSPEHSWFHHFVAPTLIEEPPTIAFNWFPFLTSVVAALGGLGLGWLMYWRKPLKAGQPDPLIGALGPIHPVLRNKYGIDELYGRMFVQPSQWFSRVVVNEWMDHGIIDGILHFIARVFVWIGDFFKVLNTWLIDGFGDGVSELVAVFGGWIRYAQTGRVQQYLLWVVVAALIIGLIFAVSTGVLQAGG